MPGLNIYTRRERALVGALDHLLALVAGATRPFRRRRGVPRAPGRILLLRLERIGDLVMTLPAVADVRALAPGATIDLVVGSWNAALARAIDEVSHVETLDARWLARAGTAHGLAALLGAARRWRKRQYDLAINFEPDIRTNLLLAASGAAWTAGYTNGGGGPLLDAALDYDPGAHTSDNARRLVQTVFGRNPPRQESGPAFVVPQDAARKAMSICGTHGSALIGVHASGGRAVKQWDPERFGEAARRLAEARDATIVLTGSQADRALVDRVKAALPARDVIDASGELGLLELAAVLRRLDLFITGDTGPMHLASAVGTPVVAVFGPSNPARYAPRGTHDRIVRIDLPCSPCNRIRRPPERCTGHTPDCLSGISVDAVVEAALGVLDSVRPRSLSAGNTRA